MTPLPTGPAIRSRAIKELVLRVCYSTYAVAPDLVVPASQIYDGFSGARTPYYRSDIDPELADLVGDGLVEVVAIPGLDGLPEKGYKLTVRGRRFVQAHCPWGKIDEFTAEGPLS